MTGELSIGLIGLGEVGQVLACDLQRNENLTLWAWDRLFPVDGSEPRRAATALSFLTAAGSMREAIRGRAIVISAVTAGECRAAALEASQALTAGTYYLDLNSVSPATKAEAARTIEAAGGRYIEAAVMSPIGPQRIASPVWLGGPHAQEFLPLARSLGFDGAAVYSGTIGAASAAKMCRSVIIKGIEALAVESLFAARRYGAEKQVLDSLNATYPQMGWDGPLPDYLISRVAEHGKRRAAEMREAGETLRNIGLEPLTALATAERQDWLVREMAERGIALRPDESFSWQELADAIAVAAAADEKLHKQARKGA